MTKSCVVDRARRKFILAAGATAAATVLDGVRATCDAGAVPLAASAQPVSALPASARDLALRAVEARAALIGESKPQSAVWTYGGELFPVVRARQHERLRVTFENALPEHTSIHWHGIRLASGTDGVPYVSQPPVLPGERHIYDFAPPDAGTFFFHPHCNESGQIGRGLLGVLLVDGDAQEPFDADHVLALRDWRVGPDGQFLPFFTTQGAARSGTFGTVRSVNGKPVENFVAAGHGDVRLRVLALDATRVYELSMEGTDAAVIAIDGHPVAPFPLKTWLMGPGQRVDLAVRSPALGKTARLVDLRPSQPHEIATLIGSAPARPRRAFRPTPLRPAAVPKPDLRHAERKTVRLQTASGAPSALIENAGADDPLAKVLLDSLCAPGQALWAIDKQSWASPEDRRMPPPLAILAAGKSYVWEIVNDTKQIHPMHLHGHAFEVLRAPQRAPRHLADTVLLGPNERAEIAFVAASGAWMFHCHLLEHQEAGMMGWIRVA
jgi:FtsP/CotA-like multicopper oxidase with cupredoxin domain